MTYAKSISLFSGAGGMDVGFHQAGFRSQLVCELDSDACETLRENRHAIGCDSNHISPRSVDDLIQECLPKGLDVVFGGPPCQGFSVAGKMDPDDSRSQLIQSFFDVVDATSPKGFVCENVKALAVFDRWQGVRESLFNRASKDYCVALLVLNASDFGVPQARERMFFVGVHKDIYRGSDKTLKAELEMRLKSMRSQPATIGDIVRDLGPAGTDKNPSTCLAKISFAKRPIMRKSPYAGMLFNGAGRPLPTNGISLTLPASMGGNKTPIVDEAEIFSDEPSFVERYHAYLEEGGSPYRGDAPPRLRRLTVRECMEIQTFPEDYVFHGRKSSIYRQIGNAVPVKLAKSVATAFLQTLRSAENAELARVVAA